MIGMNPSGTAPQQAPQQQTVPGSTHWNESMTDPLIYVVEDESSIAEVLQYNLEREGFKVRVYARGDDALSAVRDQLPDLMLLDLMLPGIDGLEVARRMKREDSTADVPIVMLTARVEEVDRIVGLELGADDYIAKPFSPREVVLRIKAVLRRSEPEVEHGETVEIGNLRLDLPGHQLYLAGEVVVLTATEFRLLRALMEGVGRVQTRDRLLNEVWGYVKDVDSRTVDTHVRRLRRKIGSESERIETVIGVGYRLRR